MFFNYLTNIKYQVPSYTVFQRQQREFYVKRKTKPSSRCSKYTPTTGCTTALQAKLNKFPPRNVLTYPRLFFCPSIEFRQVQILLNKNTFINLCSFIIIIFHAFNKSIIFFQTESALKPAYIYFRGKLLLCFLPDLYSCTVK